MKIWIAGTIKTKGWELIGAFSTEQKANRVCTTKNDFYSPIELDAVAPKETTNFPNIQFPRNN